MMLDIVDLSRWFISGASHSDINPIPTPFIKAAEMGNMDHVCIFMMGNDFDDAAIPFHVAKCK